MKLPGLTKSADVADIVAILYKKHAVYLNNPRITPEQIEGISFGMWGSHIIHFSCLDLVERLKKLQPDEISIMRKASSGEDVKDVKDVKDAKDVKDPVDQKRKREDEISPATGVDYNKFDLNKLEDNELQVYKTKMDEVYYKNYKDPKAKDFIYEIEVCFMWWL